MKQRDEQQLSAEVRAELEALDRALAGLPVDAEFDAVASLARELRDSRPEPPPGFSARLDARASDGFPADDSSGGDLFGHFREWVASVRPIRLVAPVGAVACAVLIASVAVIQSGGGGGGDLATQPAITSSPEVRAPAQADGGAAGADALQAAPSAGSAEGNGYLAPQAEGEAASGAAAAPFSEELPGVSSAESSLGRGGSGGRDRIAPGSAREVERSATLALSADGDEFDAVSDGVIEITDRYNGFVLSSEQSSTGDRSRADFELEVPSDRLQPVLADLSELAHVESRSEDSLDITAPTVSARERLTDARTEIGALLEQLAASDRPKETEQIRFRLDLARQEAANAKAEFQRLARRANLATVGVSVTSDGGGDGNWGVSEALDDIGDALGTAGGVALVTTAILLPIGLLITIVALAWRRSVRRGRERALDGDGE
ncbi:MAG: DUF4349 domain-containing protein [Solirubrobacterales bacterium]